MASAGRNMQNMRTHGVSVPELCRLNNNKHVTAVIAQILGFWVVTRWNLVGRYRLQKERAELFFTVEAFRVRD
jgi:hypothetical protein